jgi:hypothetical protein
VPIVVCKEKVVVIQDDKEIIVERKRAHSKVLKKSNSLSIKVPRTLQKAASSTTAT